MNVQEQIKRLVKEKTDLEKDLDYIHSQNKKNVIEEQIFDINDTIKILKGYEKTN